jgi:acyl-CoA thioesterase I
MACGVTGTGGIGLAAAFGAFVLTTLVGTTGYGQQPAGQFSHDCQPGSTAVVAESPLPNVAAALQQMNPIKILVVGAAPGKRVAGGGYTALIEQLVERAIGGANAVMINRSVSGELAADAANRIKTEVALTEPTLVLWQVGTKDALAYVPVNELETTVRDTIRWLREHKVDVVLAGLQYVDQMARDDHYRAVRDMLRRLAAEENVMIIRRYEAMQFIAQASKGGPNVFDEIDRTDAGYSCLAQYVARAIALGAFGKGLHPLPP